MYSYVQLYSWCTRQITSTLWMYLSTSTSTVLIKITRVLSTYEYLELCTRVHEYTCTRAQPWYAINYALHLTFHSGCCFAPIFLHLGMALSNLSAWHLLTPLLHLVSFSAKKAELICRPKVAWLLISKSLFETFWQNLQISTAHHWPMLSTAALE